MNAARIDEELTGRISGQEPARTGSIQRINRCERFRQFRLLACLALATGSSATHGQSTKIAALQIPQTDAQSNLTPLPDGQSAVFEIPARTGKRIFTVSACADCFVEIRIEQLDISMPIATLSGPGISGPVPRMSDAGAHSVTHIPFVAPQTGSYALEIHAARASASKVRITLTKIRPATEKDRQKVTAYDAFARAELVRRADAPGTAAKAISYYDQAIGWAQANGDVLLQQQALVGKTRIFLYREGNYLAGLNTAEAARALIDDSGHDAPPEAKAIDAAVWKVLSSAYYFLARYPQMLDATNRSLALYSQLGDLYWEGILEGNAANVYLETGDTPHALASAEHALSIAHTLADADGIGFTLATIAMIHDLRGEYQAAFDANEAALDEIRKHPYPDEEGQVWMGLGDLYDELNDPERERDALNRALPLLRQTHDTANESAALSDLALLDLRQGYARQGTQSLEQAMQIARSHQLNNQQSLALLGQAVVWADEGHSAAAQRAVLAGLALARKTGETADAALLLQEQGDLAARLGKTQSALAAYREAESAWSSIPNLEHAALARASMARLEFRCGNLAQARNDILQALDGFEASRKNIGGRSLRESYFASVHDFYDLAIDIAMRAPPGSAAPHDSPLDSQATTSQMAAWTIAERARARSLLDAVRETSAFSTRGVPQSLIDRSSELERQIDQSQQAILRLSATGNDSPALQDAKEQLHSLVVESEEVEAREREGASASLFGAAWHLPSLESVRARLLDPETQLLEYWAGKKNIYLWVVTAQSARAMRLCSSAQLTSAIRNYRQFLLAREDDPANEDLLARQARIARADRELDRQAVILGRLLLPIRPAPGIHRLIVVPDGPISAVPFSALRLNAGGSFLVQNYQLAEEPAASVAMELLTRPAPRLDSGRIAVFADPVYNQMDPRLTRADGAPVAVRVSAVSSANRDASKTAAPGSIVKSSPLILRSAADLDLSALPRLNASAMEAQAISSIAGARRVRLFQGFDATPAEVMQIPWRDFAIAHFATHAIVDSTRPELSGIVLSTFNSNGARQDGVLWLHDIYRASFPVPLVVLSGCRTASGKSIPGEGISGLAQAFLSSGAAGVIGSLWTVDDRAAGQMIPWLYQGLLQQHQSLSAALRSAELQMIAAHRPPYDWAGYIVEGNWRLGATSSKTNVP